MRIQQQSHSMYDQPIPTAHDVDWGRVYDLPIVNSDDPLQDTKLLLKYGVFTSPAYYLQGIQGALNECYVRASLMQRLEYAASFLPKGIHLLVLDGWRPYKVQMALRASFANSIQKNYADLSAYKQLELLNQFVAEPSTDVFKPSPHLTGGSVDVTLCDDQGNPLDLGTAFDEISTQSYSHAFENTQHVSIQAHRRMLYWSMVQAGFSNLPSEWWHFDYGNQLWAHHYNMPSAHYGVVSLLDH